MYGKIKHTEYLSPSYNRIVNTKHGDISHGSITQLPLYTIDVHKLVFGGPL